MCRTFRGRSAEVVYLGPSTRYTVLTHGGTEIAVSWQNTADASILAERGDEVWLSWLPTHSYGLAPSVPHRQISSTEGLAS